MSDVLLIFKYAATCPASPIPVSVDLDRDVLSPRPAG